jgi:ubiquinol-cytochrome c reductase cytochrome c subunit
MRRRHPLAAVVVLILALGIVGAMYALVAPTGQAEAADSAGSLTIEQGKGLYVNQCSSCHGLNAEGSSDGPSLIGAGAAAVDFQVSTGRMPLQTKGAQAPRKRIAFNEEETEALAAYVASLAPGPAIPTEEMYATDGDIQEGGEIFRTNCASCHNFIGNGGALSRGKYAVSMRDTTPKHIYEAMLTGPQAMPVFNDGALSPEQKKDVISWLKFVHAEPDPGGYSFGRIGPVSEGMAMWTVVLAVLIGAAVWLGAKAT